MTRELLDAYIQLIQGASCTNTDLHCKCTRHNCVVKSVLAEDGIELCWHHPSQVKQPRKLFLLEYLHTHLSQEDLADVFNLLL